MAPKKKKKKKKKKTISLIKILSNFYFYASILIKVVPHTYINVFEYALHHSVITKILKKFLKIKNLYGDDSHSLGLLCDSSPY